MGGGFGLESSTAFRESKYGEAFAETSVFIFLRLLNHLGQTIFTRVTDFLNLFNSFRSAVVMFNKGVMTDCKVNPIVKVNDLHRVSVHFVGFEYE